MLSSQISANKTSPELPNSAGTFSCAHKSITVTRCGQLPLPLAGAGSGDAEPSQATPPPATAELLMGLVSFPMVRSAIRVASLCWPTSAATRRCHMAPLPGPDPFHPVAYLGRSPSASRPAPKRTTASGSPRPPARPFRSRGRSAAPRAHSGRPATPRPAADSRRPQWNRPAAASDRRGRRPRRSRPTPGATRPTSPRRPVRGTRRTRGTQVWGSGPTAGCTSRGGWRPRWNHCAPARPPGRRTPRGRPARWHARHRPPLPHLGPVAGIAAVGALPVRRVGRQGQEQREPRAGPVHHLDPDRGVLDRDMDVVAADDLLAGHDLVAVLHAGVALVGTVDRLVLPGRKRVGPGGQGPRPSGRHAAASCRRR